MMTEVGLTQMLSSAINVLRLDEFHLNNWIGALRSGGYKTGCGLLRSSEDEYDAFGVLADINLAPWDWDDEEGAWSIHGNAYFAPDELLIEWLGIRNVHKPMLSQLNAELSAAVDSGMKLERIGDLFKKALAQSQSDKNRFPRTSRDEVYRVLGEEPPTLVQYRREIAWRD